VRKNIHGQDFRGQLTVTQSETYLLKNQNQGDNDLQGGDQSHTDELQESLQLCRVVAHHVDYLSGGGFGPTGSGYS
jgi:hypothetical protein